MKILYLAFVDLDMPNACRTHVLEVIRNMAELDHQVIAILPRPGSSIQFPDHVKVSFVHPWNFSWYGKLVFHLLAAIRMCYYFFSFQPRVVYEREISGNPLPALLCRLFQIPLFVEMNGILLDELAQARASKVRVAYERCLQSWELHAATGLVIPSDHMRIRFIQEYKLSPERCAFILSGFDPHTFFPGNREQARVLLGLPEDAFALVFVGCLRPGYDLSPYIRLISKLRHEFPKLVLWVVGDGVMRKNFEVQAKELDVKKEVRFLGYQPEPEARQWIHAANLCIAPHSSDGFRENGGMGTKLYAYAASARTILMHYGPTEHFPNELKSLFRLVPIGDEQATESAIRTALADQSSLDREGQTNAAWVHENATWTHTVKRSLDFIVERIDKPSQRPMLKPKGISLG